jgi:hypothetical protein
MGRELTAPRTDRTTRIPSPVTTNHASKGFVFVNLTSAGNFLKIIQQTDRLRGRAERVGDVQLVVLDVGRHLPHTVLEVRTTTIVKRFRGGLVLEARRLLYHPTPDSRVLEKKKKVPVWFWMYADTCHMLSVSAIHTHTHTHT